jgi:hypothetical protein
MVNSTSKKSQPKGSQRGGRSSVTNLDSSSTRLNQVAPAVGMIGDSERNKHIARMGELSRRQSAAELDQEDGDASGQSDGQSENAADHLFHPTTGARPKRIPRTSDLYKQEIGPEKACWLCYKIIHPGLPQKIKWDMVLGLIIVYSVCCIPYRIGFDDPAVGGWDVFDIICDLFFAADMILNFNTAYETKESDLVINRPMIAKNYLTSWFGIDFASTFPVDRTVEWASSSSSTSSDNSTALDSSGGGQIRAIKLIRVLRLTRLIKLARLLKLGKLLGDKEELLEQINPIFLKLSKTLFIIIFVAHFLACFWHFQALEEGDWGKKHCDQWLVDASVISAGSATYSVGDVLRVPVCDNSSSATLVVSSTAGDGTLEGVGIALPPDGYCQMIPTSTRVAEMVAEGGGAATGGGATFKKRVNGAIFELVYDDKVSSWRDNYIGCDISTVAHSR